MADLTIDWPWPRRLSLSYAHLDHFGAESVIAAAAGHSPDTAKRVANRSERGGEGN